MIPLFNAMPVLSSPATNPIISWAVLGAIVIITIYGIKVHIKAN